MEILITKTGTDWLSMEAKAVLFLMFSNIARNIINRHTVHMEEGDMKAGVISKGL